MGSQRVRHDWGTELIYFSIHPPGPRGGHNPPSLHSLTPDSFSPAPSPHDTVLGSAAPLPSSPSLPWVRPPAFRLGASFPDARPTLLPIVLPPVFTLQSGCSVGPGVRWQFVDVHVHSPQGISLCSQLKVGVAPVSNGDETIMYPPSSYGMGKDAGKLTAVINSLLSMYAFCW